MLNRCQSRPLQHGAARDIANIRDIFAVSYPREVNGNAYNPRIWAASLNFLKTSAEFTLGGNLGLGDGGATDRGHFISTGASRRWRSDQIISVEFMNMNSMPEC